MLEKTLLAKLKDNSFFSPPDYQYFFFGRNLDLGAECNTHHGTGIRSLRNGNTCL